MEVGGTSNPGPTTRASDAGSRRWRDARLAKGPLIALGQETAVEAAPPRSAAVAPARLARFDLGRVIGAEPLQVADLAADAAFARCGGRRALCVRAASDSAATCVLQLCVLSGGLDGQFLA